MPVFEPSTWAEVEEAHASRKPSAQTTDPFVHRVRAFTSAPERFLTPASALPSPLPHIKRTDGQFDDVLGLGRVSIVDTNGVVRRGSTPRNALAVDDFVLVPSCVEGRDVRAEAVNPSGEAFEAAEYLARVHAETGLPGLRKGLEVLRKVRARLEREAEAFRRERYASAALVESAFEGAKEKVGRMMSPRGAGKGAEFEKAEKVLKQRYEGVLGREAKLIRLRRTLGVYTRYQWVFGLGERLRMVGVGGVADIEGAVRQYLRGLKWLEAQEGADLGVVRDDVVRGFEELMEVLRRRLAVGDFSAAEIGRVVVMLMSVERGNMLTEALEKRVQFAIDGVEKGPGVRAASIAFCEGLAHVWRLGRVLAGHEAWRKDVEEAVHGLSDLYAELIRGSMLESGGIVFKEALREVGGVCKRGRELEVPGWCLTPVVEVGERVAEGYFLGVEAGLRAGAERAVERAVEVSGGDASKILDGLLMDALGEVETTAVHDSQAGKEARGADGDGQVREHGLSESAVNLLGKTCATLPGVFAQELQTHLESAEYDAAASSLKLAACCAELLDSLLPRVEDRGTANPAFDAEQIRGHVRDTEDAVRGVLERAMERHVEVVSQPLGAVAAGLVAFPEEELEESVSRTVPIKIEGISKGASELALQLALLTISTRRGSAHAGLVLQLLMRVMRRVGDVLVAVLSTDKLMYHRAAQLWVDVTYVQEMITQGADENTRGLDEALDGYARVRERAVQAVLADGYSFSLADMQVLRESVIMGGVARAGIVQECFRETWAVLRSDGEGKAELRVFRGVADTDADV